VRLGVLLQGVDVGPKPRSPEVADGVNEVFDEFFPDVRPPRCVSKLGGDRPGILVSIAMVAVTD
jgi:2-iminobutanoate/2-iminopropanoate deaminase